MEKIVIAGSGPAGLTAALYTARAGLNPLVFEGLQPGGQLTTTTDVENYPGFDEAINGTELVMKMKRQAEKFGARFRSSEIQGSDFSRLPLKLFTSDSEVVECLSVIIATGASALYLGLSSEQKLIGKGVSACATCDGSFYRNKPVAVVGGGDSAMEEALFLSLLCSHVYLIHRRSQFRASKIMVERVTTNPKIELILDTVVEEVLDYGKGIVGGIKLKNVITGKISELRIDGLFIAIGHIPNTKPFAGQVKLDEKGFIITDSTKTNVPGVFAAGDVQDKRYRQAVTAAASGCMAALEVERYLQEINA